MNSLPGWMPMASAAGRLELSKVLQATSASNTIAYPSGIQAGDIIVILDSAANGNVSPAPSAVTPSGYTLVSNLVLSSSLFIRVTTLVKLANGTETGSVSLMNGSTDAKVMLVFRGTRPVTSRTISTPNQQQTTGNPSSQSVNASVGLAPLIVIGAYFSGDPVSPRTFSPAKDGELQAGTGAWLAYKIFNSAPQNVSVDMDDEGLWNALASYYIACS